MTVPDREPVLPVDRTLTRVVLLMRLLGWAWLVLLVVVALTAQEDGVRTWILLVSTAVATVGAGLTVLAAQRGFLSSSWYVVLDALITLTLSLSGWLSGFGEFLVGGYPASWLFLVAYASNMSITVMAGSLAAVVFALLHLAMDLGVTRAYGSIQFLVVALVVGWAFDALRQRERLRLEAEAEREAAERELISEQQRSERLRERSKIARQLHDSVLQTLKLIRSSAEDASEVRYLSRVQERDLRRTISEYQSPHEDSFRARLLDALADIEDRFRVEIDHVVKDDAEMDEALRAAISAAIEAMTNAARHSGAKTIDLFSEIREGIAEISVRDRGKGFDQRGGGDGISRSIVARVAAVGGNSEVKTGPGRGTEVVITVPAP
jgi:signal transduction histidine kinase